MPCQKSKTIRAVKLHKVWICVIGYSHYTVKGPTCCRTTDGKIEDVTPGADSGLNVRTRVHEYGGGEYIIGADTVYFSNFK